MRDKVSSPVFTEEERVGLRRGVQRLREVWILLSIQFAEVREEWHWIVLMASLFPFTTLLFFRFFVPDPSAEMIQRMVTGNMVFALTIMGVNTMAQEIARQREKGHFTFYASLPISRLSFVLAIFARGFLTCLPSVLILGVLGQLVFGLAFTLNPGIVPVVLLSLLACTALGSIIGFVSPSPATASLMGQLLMMFISFLTPVMVTPEMLPAVLRWIGSIFPTTYIAEALRIVLFQGWTPQVTQNALLLTVYVAIGFYVVARRVDWRVEA